MLNEPQIGILNLSSHENYVRDVEEIATEVGSVTIFTTPDIYKRVKNSSRFDESPNQWVVKNHSESERGYLSRVEQRINEKVDFLIVFPFYGDIFDYISYVGFDPCCEYLLYSFDLNGMIGRNPTLTPKVYNYLKYPLKKAILRRIDRLLVEFSPIAEYAASEKLSVDIESFTPVLYSNPEDLDSSIGEQRPNSITVTIPGMIDSTRRDYDEVLEALNNLPKERIGRIELILLGKPVGDYGATVIERAKRLRSDGMDLEYYKDWIPTDTFAEKLNTTDLLVSPLHRQRPIDGFIEQYGRSKGTGVISDAISYATPLLLPSWFEVPKRTKSGIHTYRDSTDLRSIIIDLIENENHRREWFDGALEMAQQYSKSKQSARLRRIIEKRKTNSAY